jgi:hypothetical protein
MKMNEQKLIGLMNTSEIVEQTDQGTNSSVEISDYFDDETPVDAVIIDEALVKKIVTYDALINKSSESSEALLKHEESEQFRASWNAIQGKFVDEPRSAVQQADTLVTEVIAKITEMFASEHSSLESQWNQGNEVSTEQLRQALQHYRSFFNRLVLKNEE